MDINDQVLCLIGNKVGLVKRYETALKTAEELASIFEPFGYFENAKQYSALKVLNQFIEADLADMQGAIDLADMQRAIDRLPKKYSYACDLRLISTELNRLMATLVADGLSRKVTYYNSDEASHVAA